MGDPRIDLRPGTMEGGEEGMGTEVEGHEVGWSIELKALTYGVKWTN